MADETESPEQPELPPEEPAKPSLMEEVKLALMLTNDRRDPEVRMLVDAALADMRRVGVREELLDEESLPPLVKMAVACYCKSRFGFDNPDFERFGSSYRQLVCDLLNSPANSADRSGDDAVF